jgi:hypothetical protein
MASSLFPDEHLSASHFDALTPDAHFPDLLSLFHEGDFIPLNTAAPPPNRPRAVITPTKGFIPNKKSQHFFP